MEQKLLLVDGNSLINRAYYAFGTGGGLTWGGAPTNATYGFLNMFLKAVTDLGTARVVVAFDVRAKTFRHKMFDGYKCTRKGMPDDLAVQLADLKKLLEIMQVTYLEAEGYEADDIIGTLAKKCCPTESGNTVKSIILSADRDGLQLVDENTELHLTKTGVTHLDIWDLAKLKKEYGLKPHQMVDLKALMGDKSDCIPGAQGVGEKTALMLMQEYGSIEKIYENLGNIKDSLREKLGVSKDMVYLSRDLARINTDVPVECGGIFSFPYPMDKTVYDAFDARGFKSFCKRSALWKEDYYSDSFGLANENESDSESVGANEKTELNKVSETVEILSEAETMTVNDLQNFGKIVSGVLTSAKHLAISYDETAYYVNEYKIPLCVDLLSGGLDESHILAAIKPILENNTPKIVFDSKAFKEKLLGLNIGLNNTVADVKICEHLLTNKTVNQNRKVSLNDFDILAKLEKVGMLSLYRDIELPLVDVLIDMQKFGARLDMTALGNALNKLKSQIEELSEIIYKFADEKFNINSPQQLGEILFKKLGIQTTRKNKTGYSTDEAELTKKAKHHPIVPHILRYRKVFKLFSTYIQGFSKLADENGFIHSTFNNTGTVTGRLSSSEPNIQNIPARSEDSEFIRKLFISRFENGKIIAADYSQIELRLLAHFSNDEIMIQAFANGRDIHTETAVKIFGVHDKDVTHDMRRAAKAVNFGIVYGMSAFGLSESIGCSVSEAARFIETYFAQFPRVKNYLDKCRDFAITKGYAKTILGRRRQLPELNSSNHNTVQFGVRAAMNMPMQGSASDIIKKAMVELRREFAAKKIGAKLIAQVHDELIFDCPPDQIQPACQIIKQIMESSVSLSVPLAVEIKIKDTF